VAHVHLPFSGARGADAGPGEADDGSGVLLSQDVAHVS